MTTGPERSTRGAIWAVRRLLAPAALQLEGELARLTEENAALRSELDSVQRRLDETEERLGRQVGELGDGLHEARRLNLRIAELTDLVTELVLPLHDREIDPRVLGRLRADTL